MEVYIIEPLAHPEEKEDLYKSQERVPAQVYNKHSKHLNVDREKGVTYMKGRESRSSKYM